MKNKEIRAQARERMSGNWLKMLLVNIIVFALIGGGEYAYVINQRLVIMALISILGIVLVMGQTNLTMKIAQGKKWRADNFFVGIKAYVRAYVTNFLIGILILVFECILLFLVLVNVFAGFVGIGDISSISGVVDNIPVESLHMENIAIALVLIILLIAVLVFIDVTYSMMTYIILEKKDDIGIIKTLRYSRKLMKGKKFKLIGLYLSFFFWGILSIIPFGLGFLFLSSYIHTAIGVFYLDLLKDKDELASEMGLDAHLNLEKPLEYRVVEVTSEETEPSNEGIDSDEKIDNEEVDLSNEVDSEGKENKEEPVDKIEPVNEDKEDKEDKNEVVDGAEMANSIESIDENSENKDK